MSVHHSVPPMSMGTSVSFALSLARYLCLRFQEEYEQLNNHVRLEKCPDGRVRMIKGFGQVLETIVSKQQQHSRNRQATQGDGRSFESELYVVQDGGVPIVLVPLCAFLH